MKRDVDHASAHIEEEHMSSIHQIRLARILVILSIVALGFAGRSTLAAPAAQRSVTVEMRDFDFAPKTLTITAGTTVNWPNTGQAPHTATSDTGLWDSGRKAAGESFSFTFNQAGTFPYYCTLHGTPGGVGMAGTIVVTAAQAPAATATTAPARPAPAATRAPAGAAPAATATTAPAAGGANATPPTLPATGQSSINILLLGIATLSLVAGLVLNRSARRRANNR
jgi:LPXTG-motif cell wall-anchored protein